MNNGIQGYPDYPKPLREYRFDFTGLAQPLIISSGVGVIEVEIAGAAGGGPLAGLGAILKGTLQISSSGEEISIYVGGKGGNPSALNGGWNGGGSGLGSTSYGGGGATDIRIGGTDLEHRVVVAGAGGGGVEGPANGGNGGNPNGGNGANNSGSGATTEGPGGNGSLGQGGNAVGSGLIRANGGGGGYYGGGGATGSIRGGGGGSSLIPSTFSHIGWNSPSGPTNGNGYVIIRYYGGDDVR